MKVSKRRCGIKVEAQPVSGQTCPIEHAHGATVIGQGKRHGAICTGKPKSNGLTGPLHPHEPRGRYAPSTRDLRPSPLERPICRDRVALRFVAWRNNASADKAVYRRNHAIPEAETSHPATVDLGDVGFERCRRSTCSRANGDRAGRRRERRPTLILPGALKPQAASRTFSVVGCSP